MSCAVFGRKEAFRTERSRTKACSEFLLSLPKPCGIMAENDYAAAYVLDIAGRLKIPIPSKLSVIGVDNDPQLCENARPALSSIHLDFEQAGYRACEILSISRHVEPVVAVVAADFDDGNGDRVVPVGTAR